MDMHEALKVNIIMFPHVSFLRYGPKCARATVPDHHLDRWDVRRGDRAVLPFGSWRKDAFLSGHIFLSAQTAAV
jgi:hypothetical protein